MNLQSTNQQLSSHRLCVLRRCAFALAVSAGLFSCSNDSPEYTTWDEFRRAATTTFEGKEIYIVEGDLAVSLQELRERYEAYSAPHGVATESQTSIVNRVGGVDDVWADGVNMQLTYCISDEFGAQKTRVENEMAAAAAAWESAAHVDFHYLPEHDDYCNNTNPAVLFSVRPWSSNGACAFFPSGGGCVPRTLVMNLAAFPSPSAPNVTSLGVFRHELGHILGLRHEHTRPDSGVCFENSSWRALTPYDRDSVMHYPWCNGNSATSLNLTASDIAGVRALYGSTFVPGEHQFLFGDVDANGRTDVVQAWRGWNTLPMCRNFASGLTCTNPAAISHDSGSPEQQYLTGDFNGDGRADVFQAYRGWSSIPLCISSGSGWTCGNPAATLYDSGSPDQRFVTGDFNGDGRTDVFQTYRGWSSIPVCTSTGSGWSCSNPGATLYDSGSSEQQFLTGDFNGDGRADVFQTYRGWSSIPVCTSTGSGWSCSNPGATLYDSGSSEQQFLTGDYNGDGRTDVFQAYRGWSSIPVCASTGSGWSCSNPGATLYDSGSSEQQFLTGDFNGDGRADVFQTYRGWSSIPVCTSTGSGWSCSNLPATIYNSGASEQRFVAKDMNGDGRTDIVQTYRGWSSYPVCYSTGSGWSCSSLPARIYNPGIE